ncbi:sugar ABC transporter substrate-binding protein [Streptomyces sp. NPDC057580]|uniref:sugar ABC transporter substrate-binding protein n=1 Tax=Streptomyces sp. NPDC057580 TaxID=3346173 RepID=UPI0036B3B5D5
MNGFSLRRSSLAAVAAAAVLSLGACSTGVSSTGNDNRSTESSQPADVSKASDLKIAFFSSGENNTYLQAGIAAVKETAKKAGASVDVFDGKFDAQVQYNQVQTAITSGKYNAFVLEANDGNLLCNIATKQAKQAKILVSVINQPLCGRALKSGEDLWSPGTVTMVAGQTSDLYQDWVKQVARENPDGGKVAAVMGTSLSTNSISFKNALKMLVKENPKFKVVSQQYTDYTTPKASAAAQTILQANPDLDIIMSNYSGMTVGVTAGVKAAGRQKSVKVYDMGGDSWALKTVKSGDLAGTVVFLPKQEGVEGVQALIDTVEGKTVPRFIDLNKTDTLPADGVFVSPKNVDAYTAEY